MIREWRKRRNMYKNKNLNHNNNNSTVASATTTTTTKISDGNVTEQTILSTTIPETLTTTTRSINSSTNEETMRSIANTLDQVEEQLRYQNPRNGVVFNDDIQTNTATEQQQQQQQSSSTNDNDANTVATSTIHRRHNMNGFNILRGAGRSFRDSVQSALGTIRTQLESVSCHTTSTIYNHDTSNTNSNNGTRTDVVASETATTTIPTNDNHHNNNTSNNPYSGSDVSRMQEFSRRLQVAEIAHNNQIPLTRLQEELDRRSRQHDDITADGWTATAATSSSNRMILVDRNRNQANTNNNINPTTSTPEKIDNDNSNQETIPNRRASMLLPSRRKAEEMSENRNDLDIHVNSKNIPSPPSVADDDSNLIINNNKSIRSFDVLEQDDDQKIDEESIDTTTTTKTTPILLTVRSRTNLGSSSVSVLFPLEDPSIITDSIKIINDNSDSNKKMESTSNTTVYSWGTGMYSLHDTSIDIGPNVTEPGGENVSNILAESSVVDQSTRVGRSDIVNCSIGPNHVLCCTSTGQVFGKGRNIAGAIDPYRTADIWKEEQEGEEVDNNHYPNQNKNGDKSPSEAIFHRPIVVESLGPQARITQVACGVDHTVALRSNGTVLTWGSNEYGQLGHGSFKMTSTFVRPAAMVVAGKRITSIAAGDGYTLVLTSRMTVLACGDELLAGYRNDTGTDATALYRPAPIPALQDLPIVTIVAGIRHAVAITVHGSTLVWGENLHGCCAREYPRSLSSPLPIHIPFTPNSDGTYGPKHNQLPTPLSNWIQIDNNCCTTTTTSISNNNNIVSIPNEVKIISAALGRNHTMLLTESGRVYGCGSNQCGQLGIETKPKNGTDANFYTLQAFDHPNANNDIKFVQVQVTDDQSILLDSAGDIWQLGGSVGSNNTSKHYMGECHRILSGKGIKWIAAGGTNNVVAVSIKVGRNLAVRISSTQPHDPQEQYTLEGCVEDLLQSLDTAASTIVPISTEETINGTNSVDSGEYMSIVKHITGQMQELLKTPAVLNGLFLDPTELDELYTKLLTVNKPSFQKEITTSIERSMWQGLQSVQADCARLIFPEQVRFLLLYIQFPLFIDHWKSYQNNNPNDSKDAANADNVYFDRRGDLILAWCEVVLDLPYEGYRALMTWATSAYTHEQFQQYILRPLLSQLEKGLTISCGVGAESRAVPGIVAILRWLYLAAQRTGFTIAKPEYFYCDAISQMNPDRLLQELVRFRKTTEKKDASSPTGFSLIRHPFLLSLDTKRLLLQMENEYNMLQTAASGLTYNAEVQQFEFNPFWVLDIDREHLLVQTLDKISRATPKDLRRKLRVVFKGEDGVDAGGVTREFFQLLSTQLFEVDSGMWTDRYQDGKVMWFNADCSWNDEGYFLSGVLMGLAVYNSVLLDFSFPHALYRKLLRLPLGLEDMVDDQIRKGLQSLLDYDQDDVEDVFCLTFDVAWMDLGVERRRELKPNGSNIPVTSENKEEYVLLYTKWSLQDSIYPQYDAFERGFIRVMENSSFESLLQPNELELLVVGVPELDFAALKNNTTYEGGYTADSDVIKHFWQFIEQASHDVQVQLLKFVTGSCKAPIGGLGKLPFKIQRAGPDSNQLPTSHTCFNTLLLPDYGDSYTKLEHCLGRAVIECEGFGLQ